MHMSHVHINTALGPRTKHAHVKYMKVQHCKIVTSTLKRQNMWCISQVIRYMEVSLFLYFLRLYYSGKKYVPE